jgi:hypothetical protein
MRDHSLRTAGAASGNVQHPNPRRMACSALCQCGAGTGNPLPPSPSCIILQKVLSGENSAGTRLTRKMMGTAFIPLIIGMEGLAIPAIIIEGWRNIFAQETPIASHATHLNPNRDQQC